MRKQNEMPNRKAKKLGSKQPECHPHKSQLKPRAENRTKLMCLKKDVSFEELEHKIEKLATQTNNTCAEISEIRKWNKTMRKKVDKILSILENEKGEKETQDDEMGLLVSSLEDMYFGGKVESITMGEHTDISSRNEVKACVQHLSSEIKLHKYFSCHFHFFFSFTLSFISVSYKLQSLLGTLYLNI
jgi:septal ring factor EnvC (AmiA/AmiB activator)